MKTAEQIRERIASHRQHIGWLEESLGREIASLQSAARDAGDDPAMFDFAYHLRDHAAKIEKVKSLVAGHADAIKALEWVLAE